MNKHTDAMITAALRDLDPAGAVVLTDAERDRAEATFARILAAPSDRRVPEQSKRPRRTRLLAAVGIVAAAGAAVAAVPSLLLGGGSAFASWTPTPEPLTGAAAAKAATTCRSALGMPDEVDQTVITERRGGWTYVLLAGSDSEGACLMPEGLPDQQARTREGLIGHYGLRTVQPPHLAADDVVGYGGTSSLATDGFWNFGADEEWIHSVEGYVGSDVIGVTVHTSLGIDVEASVADGRFAAWWPSPKASSENVEKVDGPWTYTVTLADGTTRHATHNPS